MQEGQDEEQSLTQRDREYELEEAERRRKGILARMNWGLLFLVVFTVVIFLAFFLPMLALPYKDNHNIYLIRTNNTGVVLNGAIQRLQYDNMAVEADLAAYSVSLNRSSQGYTYSLYTRDADLDYDILYTVWTSSMSSVIIKTNIKTNESTLHSLVPAVIRNIFTSAGGLYAIGVPSGLYNVTTSYSTEIKLFDGLTLSNGGAKGKHPVSYYFSFIKNTETYIALIDISPNSTRDVQVKFNLTTTFGRTNTTFNLLDFTYLTDSDEFVLVIQEYTEDRPISVVLVDSTGRFKNSQTIPDTPAQFYESWLQYQKGTGHQYVVCVLRNWSWRFTGVVCYKYESTRNELEVAERL
eukprot:TRINITY_DN1520_c1_g2_i1.p1 TRINITY_DN1520_c1_g2~~TRINITY_DN1520_c1_g2_i1.p1  ORF type:complete len:352 (-),score=45.37 TRINITY_DN1520_c1_g2_i1:95-1150(-)